MNTKEVFPYSILQQNKPMSGKEIVGSTLGIRWAGTVSKSSL